MTKPKPINDPHTGDWRVVVSFRVSRKVPWANPADIEAFVQHSLGRMLDLAVGVSKIGAGGERSEDEGRWDHPAALANLDDVQHVHATEEIDPGSRL